MKTSDDMEDEVDHDHPRYPRCGQFCTFCIHHNAVGKEWITPRLPRMDHEMMWRCLLATLSATSMLTSIGW